MKKMVLVAVIFTVLIACEKPEIINEESKELVLNDSEKYLIDKDDIQEPDER